jgi:hypothetical protein
MYYYVVLLLLSMVFQEELVAYALDQVPRFQEVEISPVGVRDQLWPLVTRGGK